MVLLYIKANGTDTIRYFRVKTTGIILNVTIDQEYLLTEIDLNEFLGWLDYF